MTAFFSLSFFASAVTGSEDISDNNLEINRTRREDNVVCDVTERGSIITESRLSIEVTYLVMMMMIHRENISRLQASQVVDQNAKSSGGAYVNT